jgi:hypothetical protein
VEALALAGGEPSLKYHPCVLDVLTRPRQPGLGPCQAGSLTGAVASQNVTEAPNGTLRRYGNPLTSVKAEGCLTARGTPRAGTKVGLSDPVVLGGRAIA